MFSTDGQPLHYFPNATGTFGSAVHYRPIAVFSAEDIHKELVALNKTRDDGRLWWTGPRRFWPLRGKFIKTEKGKYWTACDPTPFPLDLPNDVEVWDGSPSGKLYSVSVDIVMEGTVSHAFSLFFFSYFLLPF